MREARLFSTPERMPPTAGGAATAGAAIKQARAKTRNPSFID